jgi:hypothetical protein
MYKCWEIIEALLYMIAGAVTGIFASQGFRFLN